MSGSHCNQPATNFWILWFFNDVHMLKFVFSAWIRYRTCFLFEVFKCLSKVFYFKHYKNQNSNFRLLGFSIGQDQEPHSFYSYPATHPLNYVNLNTSCGCAAGALGQHDPGGPGSPARAAGQVHVPAEQRQADPAPPPLTPAPATAIHQPLRGNNINTTTLSLFRKGT